MSGPTQADRDVAIACVFHWDTTRNGSNPCGDQDSGAEEVASYRRSIEAPLLARINAMLECVEALDKIDTAIGNDESLVVSSDVDQALARGFRALANLREVTK